MDADLDDVVIEGAPFGRRDLLARPQLPAEGEVRPLLELRAWGVLWLLNAVVFHPRGFALALHLDDDGDIAGWSLQGDGHEPWRFAGDDAALDELFDRTMELLAPRGVPMPPAANAAAA